MPSEALYLPDILRKLSEFEFKSLGSFNAGDVGVFWGEQGGPSPWEMHPDSDEFLYILKGAVQIELLPTDNDDARTEKLNANSAIIIPKGVWHRQTFLEKSQELYVTPGKSLHSDADDPRS